MMCDIHHNTPFTLNSMYSKCWHVADSRFRHQDFCFCSSRSRLLVWTVMAIFYIHCGLKSVSLPQKSIVMRCCDGKWYLIHFLWNLRVSWDETPFLHWESQTCSEERTVLSCYNDFFFYFRISKIPWFPWFGGLDPWGSWVGIWLRKQVLVSGKGILSMSFTGRAFNIGSVACSP